MKFIDLIILQTEKDVEVSTRSSRIALQSNDAVLFEYKILTILFDLKAAFQLIVDYGINQLSDKRCFIENDS